MTQTLASTVTRASLAKALEHISRIIEKRNTIPILAHVLIVATKEGLTLRGTDLDIEASTNVLATTTQPGAITVPAHLLHDLTRKLPDGANIALTVDDEMLSIRSGKSRFRLQTLPSTDLPELSVGEFPTQFKMKASAFKHLLESAAFAMGTEKTRYYLNGVYLHTITNVNMASLRAVATDGHRLARLEDISPDGSAQMPGIILPRKATNEVMKLLDDATDTVSISVSQAKIRFEVGNVVLTSKLVDGIFPDYQRVIPTGNDKVVRLDKEPFEKAVDRVSTMASERGRAIRLSLSTGKVTLSVNDPDSGSASEELDADYDGALFEIGFNAKYLLDVLGNCEGEIVTVQFGDPGSPALFSGEKDAALFVLMPMRV